MSMQWKVWESASAFLERNVEWLGEHESHNSLPLGLALRTQAGSCADDEGTRFFSVERDGEPVGAAMQTPGRPVIFTRMGEDVARFISEQLPEHLENLTGCVGPKEVTDLVAQLWRAQQPGELELHARMRLFELTDLTSPPIAEGAMRQATQADFEFAQRWMYAFGIDCNLPGVVPGQLPRHVPALDQRSLYLWEVDGQPVACAAWARPVRECITIGFVYTPNECRGRGYASNVVAGLTAGLLDGSLYQPARKRVNLFTDLANPTSNSIYRKLGYQPIGDHNQYMYAAKAD